MKTTRIIGRGLGFGLAALLGLATGAHAQGAYPNKPVKLELVFPRRDLRVSPLEEAMLAAHVAGRVEALDADVVEVARPVHGGAGVRLGQQQHARIARQRILDQRTVARLENVQRQLQPGIEHHAREREDRDAHPVPRLAEQQ